MRLYEFEAKKLFLDSGIPVPNSELVYNVKQTKNAIEKLGFPVVIKAQILAGGRGKAGGILSADSLEDSERKSAKLLNSKIKGKPVRSVLIEKKVTIKKELYFGITVDRENRCYLAIASKRGGINIEEAAESSPAEVLKKPIEPQLGFKMFHAREVARFLGYEKQKMLELASILHNSYLSAMNYDAETFEINPLVETDKGDFVAVDARVVIDQNSIFRHPQFKKRSELDTEELSEPEIKAKENALDYVKLEGKIGVVGNGAGLVMATLDLIKLFGGEPANFLDLGGGASIEKTVSAIEIVLYDPDVKVVLVNILGGITRGDVVAKALVDAKESTRTGKPVVIRLVGTNEEEGKKILLKAGFQVFDSMEEAARKAVELSLEV